MKQHKIKLAYVGLLSEALRRVYELSLSEQDEVKLDKALYSKPVLDKVRHMCKTDFNIRYNDKGCLIIRKK